MTTDSTLQAEAEAPAYAVRLDIEHPANQRRLTNFPLFIGTILRFVLLTPHLLMLSFLVYAQYLAYFMATFVILFRGRYPVGLFKFQVSVLRWQANVTAYYRHLFDEYPPLDMDQRPDRALRFEVDYPVQPSRWLNMPLLGILTQAHADAAAPADPVCIGAAGQRRRLHRRVGYTLQQDVSRRLAPARRRLSALEQSRLRLSLRLHGQISALLPLLTFAFRKTGLKRAAQ